MKQLSHFQCKRQALMKAITTLDCPVQPVQNAQPSGCLSCNQKNML